MPPLIKLQSLTLATTSLPRLHGAIHHTPFHTHATAQHQQSSSSPPSHAAAPPAEQRKQSDNTATASSNAPPPKRKTMTELDEELRLKLENMSGDGGAAGIEYEGGKAEGLKRGVKENMFRVI